MYTKTMIRDDAYLGGIYERITWIIDYDLRSVRCKIAKYDYTNRGKILDYVLKGETICSPQDNWDPVVGMLESWGKAMITGMHFDLQEPNGKFICTSGWGRFKRWAVDQEGCEIRKPAKDVVLLRRYLKKEQKAKERCKKLALESFNDFLTQAVTPGHIHVAEMRFPDMTGMVQLLEISRLAKPDPSEAVSPVETKNDPETVEEPFTEDDLRYPRPPSIISIPPSMTEIRSKDEIELINDSPVEIKNDPEPVKGSSPRLMTVDGPEAEKEKASAIEISKKSHIMFIYTNGIGEEFEINHLNDVMRIIGEKQSEGKIIDSIGFECGSIWKINKKMTYELGYCPECNHLDIFTIEGICKKCFEKRTISKDNNDQGITKEQGVSDANVEVSSPKDSSGKDSS